MVRPKFLWNTHALSSVFIGSEVICYSREVKNGVEWFKERFLPPTTGKPQILANWWVRCSGKKEAIRRISSSSGFSPRSMSFSLSSKDEGSRRVSKPLMQEADIIQRLGGS